MFKIVNFKSQVPIVLQVISLRFVPKSCQILEKQMLSYLSIKCQNAIRFSKQYKEQSANNATLVFQEFELILRRTSMKWWGNLTFKLDFSLGGLKRMLSTTKLFTGVTQPPQELVTTLFCLCSFPCSKNIWLQLTYKLIKWPYLHSA